jgi:hypothetical protein
MVDLLFFLKCSGPNVREDNLRDTITSFVQKNKNIKFSMFFSIDEHCSIALNNILKENNVTDDMILEIQISNKSWATDFNYFFSKYKSFGKWILISHDDIVYVTENYFEKILENLKNIDEEKIGWVTSTNNHYVLNEGRVVTDTFRIGFHLDSNAWPAMWYLHNMQHLKNAHASDVLKNINLFDIPSKPVKIHGIMSAVMITTVKSLEKIGLCEDWTNYTMMVDADWSLESLKNNLINIWIPEVHHLHPIRRNLRPTNNKWEVEAHYGFYKKWGFYKDSKEPHGISRSVFGLPQSTRILNVDDLRKEFANTNIPWSSYRNSFDWEYI